MSVQLHQKLAYTTLLLAVILLGAGCAKPVDTELQKTAEQEQRISDLTQQIEEMKSTSEKTKPKPAAVPPPRVVAPTKPKPVVEPTPSPVVQPIEEVKPSQKTEEQLKIEAQNNALNYYNLLKLGANVAFKESTPSIDEILARYEAAGAPLTNNPAAISQAIHNDTISRLTNTYNAIISALNQAILTSTSIYEREIFSQKIDEVRLKLNLMQITDKPF